MKFGDIFQHQLYETHNSRGSPNQETLSLEKDKLELEEKKAIERLNAVSAGNNNNS